MQGCPAVCLSLRGDDEEAVFSSSEDRIRASQASVAGSGPSIVLQETSSVSSEVPIERVSTNRVPDPQAWVRRTAESLFSVFFPSDCRLCGEPLLNISRLPVCPDCVAGVLPARGKMCSVCGERVLSSYAETDPDGLRRCPVCRRIDRPFERAVAYGSYEGGLRELIHLLKYNGVRPAAKVLGRMLAEALAALDPEFEQAMLERGLYDQQEILVIPVPLYQVQAPAARIQSGGIDRSGRAQELCRAQPPATCRRPSSAHPRHPFADRPDQPPAPRKPTWSLCRHACRRSHWPRRPSRG